MSTFIRLIGVKRVRFVLFPPVSQPQALGSHPGKVRLGHILEVSILTASSSFFHSPFLPSSPSSCFLPTFNHFVVKNICTYITQHCDLPWKMNADIYFFSSRYLISSSPLSHATSSWFICSDYARNMPKNAQLVSVSARSPYPPSPTPLSLSLSNSFF
jgi:hypothetical protein